MVCPTRGSVDRQVGSESRSSGRAGQGVREEEEEREEREREEREREEREREEREREEREREREEREERAQLELSCIKNTMHIRQTSFGTYIIVYRYV